MARSAGKRPLAGAHAVVTGASRGIGAATSEALAGLGASVTLMARDMGTLLERASSLSGKWPQSFQPVKVDVTDPESVVRGFAEARDVLGDPAILVNNAGGVETAPFGRIDDAHWERMIALNLNSVFLCSREVLPAMVESGGGHVINIASTAGLEGYAYVAAYTAAKHGVVGLTRALAQEVAGTGVTVNAICPGYTDTDLVTSSARVAADKTGRSEKEIREEFARMNAGGKLIAPAQVAERVAWLCLPEQHAVNGETIVIS